MKINRLKIMKFAILSLICSLWSESQCMEEVLGKEIKRAYGCMSADIRETSITDTNGNKYLMTITNSEHTQNKNLPTHIITKLKDNEKFKIIKENNQNGGILLMCSLKEMRSDVPNSILLNLKKK